MAASLEYTTDWAEARERMNKEISERLGFLEVPEGGAGGGAPEGGGTPSGGKDGSAGGGGAAGGGASGAGNPFQTVLSQYDKKRVDKGTLRGIKAQDMANSKYSETQLVQLLRDANHDTGVRGGVGQETRR